MKTEKTKPKPENNPIIDTEAHSYNNPTDLDSIMTQEVEALNAAKEKIKTQAAYLDIIEENGSRYAVVKNSLDNQILYKTENPRAIEFLF